MLSGLDDLHQAMLNERKAVPVAAIIEQRKIVGRLTAGLSYLLIRPFLENEQRDFCRFVEEVGAVGCLVDSVIDLRADAKLGLISFKPTIGDFLILLTNTVREGRPKDNTPKSNSHLISDSVLFFEKKKNT